jgi:hypothetical protein
MHKWFTMMACVMLIVLGIPGVLTAAKEVPRKLPDLQAYPVYQTTKIYKGSHVCVNTSGYAVAGADTAGLRYVGIAYETVDNSAGSSGDLSIRTYAQGTFKLTATSISSIAFVGRMVYLVDSGTVDDTSTNKIPVGVIVEWVDSTTVWVRLTVSSELIGYQDHVYINTDKSDKNVRLNCKTFDVNASIVGVQMKPRGGVTLTDDICGMESMPGLNDTFGGKGIVCFKAEPYFGSTGAAGALTGDIRGYEVTLGAPAGVTSIAGVISALKAINNCDKAPTGGIFVIHVPASGGGQAWTGLAYLPEEAGIGNSSDTGTSGTKRGYIPVKVGTATRYIRLYDSGA